MRHSRSLQVEMLARQGDRDVAVATCPDREERHLRIEQLKARIESGTYTINSKTLAQTLRQSFIVRVLLQRHDSQEAKNSH